MQIKASTPEEYISQLTEDHKGIINQLREVVSKNLPTGFEEQILYQMITFVVPLSRYPKGYLNNKTPLPFLSIASQKNHVAIYHMGLYAQDNLEQWFLTEYQNKMGKAPDMGKSCIRFRNANQIPYELIGELCRKVSVEEFVDFYENRNS